MAITYFSAGAASQLIKNSNSNGNGKVMCKIENKEFQVNWINCNNKTFSAERKGSGGYQEFEKYKTAIEQDRFFYKRY